MKRDLISEASSDRRQACPGWALPPGLTRKLVRAPGRAFCKLCLTLQQALIEEPSMFSFSLRILRLFMGAGKNVCTSLN